ncbi:MAG: DNA polymerase I [Legionellales bacterium]|nr:DNA polymerase I [Legionellales bacterium]OUX64550.1 MAG: DNA polymerase I [Gammaproteobacteria bacterium TMED281]
MDHPIQPNYLIIDASGFIYRAFHALPDLRTPDNRPTGAIFGFVKMLNAMLKRFQPKKVAVVFDPKGGQSWRHDVYEEYKANRQHMPDDLVSQIEPIKIIVEAMGLPQIEMPMYEADDVIATLAKKSDGIVYIATSDKDLMQLVNDKVFIAHNLTEKIIDVDGVRDKFNVDPEQILDYLALVGDTSDNVPGVPKVGPKTAAKWLKEYSDIKNLLKNVNDIKGKVGDNLRASIDQIPISQALVRLVVDLEVEWNELIHQPADYDKLYTMYRDYNFNRMASEVSKHISNIEVKETVSFDVKEIKNTEQLKTVLDSESKVVVCLPDKITFDLIDSVEVGLTVGDTHYSYSISNDEGFDQFKEIIYDFISIESNVLIGHDLKKVIKILDLTNAKCKLFDTMLAAYLLESHHGRYDLNTVAGQYLGIQIELEKSSLGYLSGVVHSLYQTLTKHLMENHIEDLYGNLEIPVMMVLAKMELFGVRIDVNKLNEQSQWLERKMKSIEQDVFKEVGYSFNLGSPKQLQEVLYDTLKLPMLQKTPKGQPSTSESALEQLSHQYPIVTQILQHRSLAKLKNTYTDKLPTMIDHQSNRIHGQYNQAVTSTGRLSSSDPNLQNIPIRTPQGRKVREAFVARPGHTLICADYSQIELRIMAHFSKDPKLVDAFNHGDDIHDATAKEVFGVSNITDDHRRQAKAINFGLIYGMSSFGLATQIGASRQQAQSFIDHYFERYPMVKTFMDQTREFAAEHGYVKTLMGRKLYFSGINDRNYNRRQAAQRAAINAPMQGSAAEIIKLAMLRLNKYGYDLILQVHDELVFEVSEQEKEKAMKVIAEEMSKAYQLSVPLEVGIHAAIDWSHAK